MDDPLDGILSRDQIRTLFSVVEQGSFSGAATKLGVQQPAVNQMVKRLEDRLDRRLFERTTTGATLTADGEAVLIYARAMAKLGLDMTRHLRGSRDDVVIRIGIGEEFSRTSLPGVLALYDRLQTGFRIRAVCTPSSEALFELLDDDRIDVVVARRKAGRRLGETIWTEPTIWAGRPDLRQPMADPIDLVLPASGSLREMILTTLGAASRTWRIAFEGGSLSVLEAAVAAGLGVSACTARMDLRHVVPLDDASGLPPLPTSTFVLERSRTLQSDAVIAFCDALRNAANLSLSGSGHAVDVGAIHAGPA